MPESLLIWGFIVLLPLEKSTTRHNTRHIPYELAGHAMASSVGTQKAFWAYMFINFTYNGNVLVTRGWRQMMADTMGVSEKTFARYLATLKAKGFIWYKNGRLYYKGLTPANQHIGGEHKTSIPVTREHLQTFEGFKKHLFAASVTFLTRISAKVEMNGAKRRYLAANPSEAKAYQLLNNNAKKKFFKGKLILTKRSAIVPQNNEKRSSRLIVQDEFGYNGLSLSLIKANTRRSTQWAHTWKWKCISSGLIERKAAFRPVMDAAPLFAVRLVHPEKYSRMVHIYNNKKLVVAERMADQLVSMASLSKRRF